MNLDPLIKAFLEESQELLDRLEEHILDLENNPDNQEHINAVFRVMHTIKGSAGMVGFEQTYQFTHKVEDVFDLIRKGTLAFSSEAADLALSARDVIQVLLEQNDQVTKEIKSSMDTLMKSIAFLKQDIPSDENTTPEESEEQILENDEQTFYFKFYPDKDVFLRGQKPLQLLHELTSFGLVSCVCNTENVPPLSDFNPEECYLKWEIYITTQESKEAIEEVFKFIMTPEDLGLVEVEDNEVRKVGEILEDKGLISKKDLQSALNSQERIGEVLLKDNHVSSGDLKTALTEQEHIKKLNKNKKISQGGVIRVSTNKLDDFVNLVGELVTLSARLEQAGKQRSDMEISGISESLKRLMEDLRDSVLGIRMVPVGESFNSFRRVVRDISNELNKKVKLETYGNETELDKTVIERLQDPLMHVVRNSLDHGIEPPETRIKNGKEPHGTITFSAKHAGSHVIISIKDDGKGLSKKKLFDSAVSKGLISKDQNLTDEEIYKLVFLSGFSTADKVSRLSGRGVGMDVVKKEVDALGGHISVKSEEGKYTQFNFTLPLTMAIIDGLLVRVESDYYIVPLASVESCLNMDQLDIKRDSQDDDLIYYRDSFLPFFHLRKYLDYQNNTEGDEEQLVVIRTEEFQYGLVVDEVMGSHQTVIKNMGKVFRDTRSFSGASILGNGEIALILNINILGAHYKNREMQH